MKNRLFLSAAISCAALLLTGCNIVPEDDRYIPVEPEPVNRNVLLEDFTGQNCVNCPAAHEVIEKLQEQYGENLVVVSIHAGGFGIRVQRTNFTLDPPRIGLMTDEGNALAQAYGIETFPIGVVNMGSPIESDDWATAVDNAIKIPTDVSIKTTATLNIDETNPEDKGEIMISSTVHSATEREGYVQFWIVENGIKAEQKFADGSKQDDYVHNNVFRAQLYDGQKGNRTLFTGGTDQVYENSIAVRWTDKERWVSDNLSVVTIVSDNSGVLQVTRVPVKKAGEETPEETPEE